MQLEVVRNDATGTWNVIKDRSQVVGEFRDKQSAQRSVLLAMRSKARRR